ncbi:hypothetical protein U1Q18_040960 [Sarracenia purpurea var. burkii]
MDGVGRRNGRGLWRNAKQRLGLKGMISFCGSSWSLEASDTNLREENVLEEEEEPVRGGVRQIPAVTTSDPPCGGQIPAETIASSAMNLADALAAERSPRSAGPATTGTPTLMLSRSLMGLFQVKDDEVRDEGKVNKAGGGGEGIDAVCCVCMERSKGTAFIPCGHTYCRVCARDLWLNRRSCPLCNRLIAEILDIF